ncbi:MULTISPECIES: Na+/H+ antiporter NhaA [unclassified Microbacterium]|uniref:Na+/H+ antiporter NhaA n=1 Tax=unclassified Microbacterium TaxID=2609290 RepID=UPI00097F28D9|nr:Na+/H+ antiporter NhaA [Microbacterium sp. JB110]RCS61849.1 Na+/H+ antiporter NhaA [Microbacterium sp. JB110]SJM66231.1 Na+/H+ antiporter NhaA type [Frigoribacterium sp. JB110]
MKLLRSERFPAFLLLGAAALGLLLANMPFGEALIDWSHTEIGPAAIGLNLSLSHWVADLLLAIFFFTAAMELQFELTKGQLNSVQKALRPAVAALGGVLMPILAYLMIANDHDTINGWPIPTATDIAFALGVLAMFGKGLPKQVRVFLLALAIIDDIVGILFIAFLFTTDINLLNLVIGVALIVVFAILSRMRSETNTRVIVALMIIVALAAWAFIYLSGVHATIAGVMLGLVIRQDEGLRASHALEPWVNGIVLPIFAFFSALVAIPAVPVSELSPAMFAIIVALPVGKIVGITLFGWLSNFIGRKNGDPGLSIPDMLPAAALGGIGFTVSLLLSRLAFAEHPLVADEAVLGVLIGSFISLIIAAFLVSGRARHYRRLAAQGAGPSEDEKA